MLLEYRQAWGHDHFPGDLVPVFDHTLSEELFPNMCKTKWCFSSTIQLKYNHKLHF